MEGKKNFTRPTATSKNRDSTMHITTTITIDYFHYQLICRLLSRLLINSMKSQKSAKNAHLNFPGLNVTPFICFFFSKQQPKTQAINCCSSMLKMTS